MKKTDGIEKYAQTGGGALQVDQSDGEMSHSSREDQLPGRWKRRSLHSLEDWNEADVARGTLTHVKKCISLSLNDAVCLTLN